MEMQALTATAKALFAGDKGFLAMDESVPTCNRRFQLLGIPQTEESRRTYRELIISTPRLGECISGVILCDETFHQSMKDGRSFVKAAADAGIATGIKVDQGLEPLEGHPTEMLSQGLPGLKERLEGYQQRGASFAKWRAVFGIGTGIPSAACVEANAQALASYAALCHEAGLVPIVEPEVLMEGGHPMEACAEASEMVLRAVFAQLAARGLKLEAVILKPSMVLPGKACLMAKTATQVAGATIRCLLNAVPTPVAGIAFLSGGQSPEAASARLNAMNTGHDRHLPWPLSFSFSRAIQQPALEMWMGQDAHGLAAQRMLFHRARCNQAARKGDYTEAMEKS